jgi:pilus assembly protein CpaC
MKVSPEVSELDYANGTSIGGQVVPGLKTRKVNTTVEMADGQTFMIAGLLSRKVEARNQSAPFLGDVPILGTLFRSVRYERSETELVILVTPRLVEPMNPDQVPALPGAAWRYPNEAELFVNGDLGGPVKPALPQGATTDRVPPRFLGRHGFVEEASSADPATR